MIEGFIFGLIFGAVSAIYYVAHKKAASVAVSNKYYNAKGEILYINIMILDKSAAIEKGVTEK